MFYVLVAECADNEQFQNGKLSFFPTTCYPSCVQHLESCEIEPGSSSSARTLIFKCIHHSYFTFLASSNKIRLYLISPQQGAG